MDNLVRKGIQLSWLLRHDSISFNKGLIDENGWRSVDELVRGYGFTPELLQEIVVQNNKQRFEYNDDRTKLRARQGHSIPVDVEMEEAKDITEDNPNLWHGTSDKYLESIKENGLISGDRKFVHLSGDKATAIKVGKRHGGETYLICVNAHQMQKDGIKIYISRNGVYNVEKMIEPKYLIGFYKSDSFSISE